MPLCMLIDIISWLTGFFGVLMALGHWAQAWRIWKKKSAKDLSWYTFSVFSIGNYMWVIYGFLINKWPIYVPFTIGATGSTVVIILMLKYR